MKTIKLLSALAMLTAFTSCDILKQATNTTTGTVFSINGKWRLVSNIPANTLQNTVVTVSPFISQGKITTLANSAECLREGDVKWKAITSDNSNGYTIDDLQNSCNSSSLKYLPANITVINNDEIRITGKNNMGLNNVQVWDRVK